MNIRSLGVVTPLLLGIAVLSGAAGCGSGAAAGADAGAGTTGAAGSLAGSSGGGEAGTTGAAGTTGGAGTTGTAGTAAGVPMELALVPVSNGVIAANATHVYFEQRGAVSRVPVGGGAIERVSSGYGGVASIALDDTTVYVLDNGGLVVSQGAISKQAFASIPGDPTKVIMNQSNVFSLIAAGDDLVWISSTVSATTIKSMPKSGAVPVPVADLGNQAWFGGLASVGANIYYGHRMGLTSGVSAAPRAGAGVPMPLVMGQDPHILSFTADADGVYFTTGTGGNANAKDGKLWKAPLAGGAPTMLASGINEPGKLVADGANIYWLDQGMYATHYSEGSISRVAKAGGAPKVITSGVDFPSTVAYAVAGGSVFYVTAVADVGDVGQLLKIAK